MPSTKPTIAQRQDDELPSYGELSKLYVLPSYLSACPLKPYRPFPTVLHACRRLSHLNAITFQEGSEENDIYRIETRRGFNKIEPLGSRAGILLRNGPGKKDQVLAAAGEKSPWARYCKDGTTSSVFFLPPFEFGTNSRAMVMEAMKMTATEDGSDTFTFFVEVEPIWEWKRQKFQWVQQQIRKDVFSLFRCGKADKTEYGTDLEAMPTAASSASSSPVNGEMVATLVFHRGFASGSREFTLTMHGSLGQGILGERCTLSVVVTAVWIWSLQRRRRGETVIR
ncbi:hypothetical protein AAL_00790 [Moelleriella libera RCEF 2490]|uniref:Uncharacterized protein n=1 Tax=Moelleriella libera RCEF 2490 TaxID=1081109 RepID=A0A166RQK8_9HYPO|nr:hypothetical protein AAL_00790 [Moelleriella libera RCEF 2490]